MAEKPQVKKVVLAYSGGLDTSVIVPWLIENYNCEVICYTADLGQGEEIDDIQSCGSVDVLCRSSGYGCQQAQHHSDRVRRHRVR